MNVLRRRLYLRCAGGEFPLSRREVESLVAEQPDPGSAVVVIRIDRASKAGRGRRLTLHREEEELVLCLLDQAEQRGALTARLHALQLGLRQTGALHNQDR